MAIFKQLGIYFHDIPIHDATRDLIFMSHARRAERELVEQLEETSNDLKKLESKLTENKQRTDELLHSILPKEVAAKLRLNQPVPAENYKIVTILFSDIVGFTALCSDDKIVPMDIVRMLNKLYTYFDMLSGMHDVYKVSENWINLNGLLTYPLWTSKTPILWLTKVYLNSVSGSKLCLRVAVRLERPSALSIHLADFPPSSDPTVQSFVELYKSF